MKTFCEVVVSDFLPAMRALVARELINSYKLTQTDVAKKMGMTQPAISYYLRELRGTKTKVLEKNERLMDLVKKTAADMAAGGKEVMYMHDICERLKQENLLSDKERLQCCGLCKC